MRTPPIWLCTAFAMHLASCTVPADAQSPGGEAPLDNCRVVDGDTLRCGEERIRLLGIDAPELPGHCRRGRNCAPGDPVASTEGLRAAMIGRLTILRVGTDRYGRTLGAVSASGRDLSCRQLETGQAIYRTEWDDGGVIATRCPSAMR